MNHKFGRLCVSGKVVYVSLLLTFGLLTNQLFAQQQTIGGKEYDYNGCLVKIPDGIPSNIDSIYSELYDFLVFTWNEVNKHYYIGGPASPAIAFSFQEEPYRNLHSPAMDFLYRQKDNIFFYYEDSAFAILYNEDTLITWIGCLTCEWYSSVDYNGSYPRIAGFDSSGFAAAARINNMIIDYFDSTVSSVYMECIRHYGYAFVTPTNDNRMEESMHKVLYEYDVKSGLSVHHICKGKIIRNPNDNNRYLSLLKEYASSICSRFGIHKIIFLAYYMDKP